MSGSLGSRPHRTRGSWIPRLTGVGVVVVVTAGGLTAYLAMHQSATSPGRHHHSHRQSALSSKVLKAQTVGLIDFGPDDDGDAFQHDSDDHPLMLKPTSLGLTFVTISRRMMADGSPDWTVNEMAGGSTIFIYGPDGQCLTAREHASTALKSKVDGDLVDLAHCNLGRWQRWTPVHPTTELGQAFAAYRNDQAGYCLTAPRPLKHGRANPGPATLAKCGPPRDRSQEIAFWWGA
jgi:hypothetical protein